MSPVPKCARGIGGGYYCGARLIERTDRFGRIHWDCPACARAKAGLCIHCPRPVYGTVGKARQCQGHFLASGRRRSLTYWRTHKAKRSTYAKRRWRERCRVTPALTRSQVGKLAGAARAAALSPERRREIAQIAGRASAIARRDRRAA